MRPIAFLLALVVLASLFGSAPAIAAPDPREMQARQAYAGGNYREALDLYIKLYAEKLHPNFLRNIGRCYQNLGNAEKAIDSFREYLRKAKDVSPDERAEVNSYIVEMEELKKRNAHESTPSPGGESSSRDNKTSATGAPAASAAAVSPEPVRPPSTAVAPATASSARPAPVNLLAAPAPGPAPPATDEASPLYTRWWFWAIVGGVVAGGVGVAAAAGVFTKTKDAPCMSPPQMCVQ